MQDKAINAVWRKDNYKVNNWNNKIKEYGQKVLFVDTEGNILTIGEDFRNAVNKNTYPIKVYHLKRTSHEKNSN